MPDRKYDFKKFFGNRHCKDFLRWLDNETSVCKTCNVKENDPENIMVNFTDSNDQALELNIALGDHSWACAVITKGYTAHNGFIGRTNTILTPRGMKEFWRVTEKPSDENKPKRGRPKKEKVLEEHRTQYDEFMDKILKDVKTLAVLNNCCCSSNIFKESTIVIPEENNFDDNEPDAINYLMLFDAVKNSGMHPFLKNIYLGYLAHEFVRTKRVMVENMEKMTSSIEVTGREISYSHVIPFHHGKLGHLHGHTGNLIIGADVSEDMITRPSIMSEVILKKFHEEIVEAMDHKMIWHLNPDHMIANENGVVEIFTPDVDIKIKNPDQSLLLIPFRRTDINGEIIGFSTSEMIIKDFIIPRFEIMLADYYIHYTGDESTIYNMLPMQEPVNFWFKWSESNEVTHKITLKF